MYRFNAQREVLRLNYDVIVTHKHKILK